MDNCTYSKTYIHWLYLSFAVIKGTLMKYPRNYRKKSTFFISILEKHLNSILVALLFIITFFGFIIYLCLFRSKLSDTITGGLISLLSSLGGFFLSSLKTSKK